MSREGLSEQANPVVPMLEVFTKTLILVLGILFLAGCSMTTLPDGSVALTKDTSSDGMAFLSNLRSIGHNDSMTATALAVGGKDTDAAQCYPALDAFVQGIGPNDPSKQQVTGALTIHEKLRLAALDVTTSNGGIASLRTACSAMVMSDTEFKARFMALMAVIAAAAPK